ncbi:hypothetical protein RPE78_14440 (plasmid) [Thioclava litoralis]|uniref:Transglycosylase SLT domain-containing protein n=1 Tax=Thioclava litoralis TaxID=3076557 RepID=A0ABZ1E325_9RHOB|nr:hypothetical protein RPE78_14440 [Thioclava sp. FTW29]
MSPKDGIDPAFRAANARARARRRARIARRLLLGAAALALGAGALAWWWQPSPETRQTAPLEGPAPPRTLTAQTGAISEDQDLAMVEDPPAPPDTATKPDPFVALLNLPRDPLMLWLPQPDAQTERSLATRAEDGLPAARLQGSLALHLSQARLAVDSDRLQLNPPSSPEDFALYQARRNRALAQRRSAPFRPAANRLAIIARPQAQRRALFQDQILLARREASGAGLLEQAGFSRAGAQAVMRQLAPLSTARTDAAPDTGSDANTGAKTSALAAKSVMALRLEPSTATTKANQLRQVSLYGPEGYRGSLAQVGSGRWVRAANPWDGMELPARAAKAFRTENAPPLLLDALYTTALQSGLSQSVAGNLVAMVAQRFSLDRRAQPEEKITLLRVTGAAEQGGALGQILYVGLPAETAGHAPRQCYVVEEAGEWACAGAATPLANGALPPAGTAPSASGPADEDDQAIRTLIARIIHVESGGQANARNPRSSALGPGQFIISTWLRMISQYHPELMQTLTRDEVLALRTDPVLSVEMVYALTRENRRYLAANGIPITAGRLYLAHFLGPQGAVQALRADPDALVSTVMGANVVSANPFLTGRSIADLQIWAERKVGGKSTASLPLASTQSPATRAYRRAIDTILARADAG